MQKFFQVHNPKSTNSEIRTIRHVFETNTPSLVSIKRVYGKEWIINYVAAWLVDLNENTNVKTKMTPSQMDFIAERIYDKYSLKLADLTLFFRSIKEGVYGSFYENLSREKIMEWLAKYYDERCEMAEMYSQSSHEKFSLIKDPLPKEMIEKIFKGVGDEKVVHNQKGPGVGERMNKVILVDLISTIKTYSTQDLKEYLIKNDSKSKTFDQSIYTMVETELDLRNGKLQP